jgi:uncharacterized membrane protein YkvA (DUF1232 family)
VGARPSKRGLGERTAALKQEVLALWFCYRDPRTPWVAKLLAMLIAAYALSPIDLIPDFIPVLGYLDEVILLPGAIIVAFKLIPASVLAESRAKAAAWLDERKPKPTIHAAAAVFVLIWAALLWGAWRLTASLFAAQ